MNKILEIPEEAEIKNRYCIHETKPTLVWTRSALHIQNRLVSQHPLGAGLSLTFFGLKRKKMKCYPDKVAVIFAFCSFFF
jgi:hypothetical protein